MAVWTNEGRASKYMYINQQDEEVIYRRHRLRCGLQKQVWPRFQSIRAVKHCIQSCYSIDAVLTIIVRDTKDPSPNALEARALYSRYFSKKEKGRADIRPLTGMPALVV